MNKFVISALVAVLVILQFISLARIGSLQDELRNTRNELRNITSQQSNQINNIYSNINETLKKQASLISSYDYEAGTVDTTNLTLPLTFQVIPREIKEDTSLTLYVSGKSVVMSRSGNSFTAEVTANIFSTLEARVAIEEGGVTRTEDLPVKEDLRYRALPTVYARFEIINASYSKNQDGLSGEYKLSGRIGVDVKPAMNGNTIENARIVIDRDGEIISEKPIDYGNEIWNSQQTPFSTGSKEAKPVPLGGGTVFIEINDKFSLSPGQTLTFTVVSVDGLGLTYRSTAEKIALDANAEPVKKVTWNYPVDTTIIGKNGEVLYEPSIAIRALD